MNTNTSDYAIELTGIDKAFGPVQANKDINMAVKRGAIHGIVGENGAGKSTLMSILFGFYQADRGEIKVNGQLTKIKNSQDAIAAQIGMVHQHFMLVERFTVLENIVLGSEQGQMLSGSLNAARKRLQELEQAYGLSVNLDARIWDLPVGLQQRVEILKTLYRGARILILDEPTAVLTPQETDQLFDILRALRDEGVTVIIITHKLREIMDLTDTVSIMRRGTMVADRVTSETSREELAELMVGRKVITDLNKTPAVPGKVLMKASNLNYVDKFGVQRLHNVNFEVRTGEIVGMAGVSGNGQSVLLEILAGIRPMTSGSVQIGDTFITKNNPISAAAVRDLKTAHIPEDRMKSGMVKNFSAAETSALGYQGSTTYASGPLLSRTKIVDKCRSIMEENDVRPPHPFLRSANFSGGNQQKLIIGREMDKDPELLLVGQPTRGVDIGAIEAIHRELLALRDKGSAIFLVSVELDEIMSLTDRILVINAGAITGELDAADADERKLGLLMTATVDQDTDENADQIREAAHV